ncbi:cytochrome P450 [Saccharopolyspora sp. K220]|uniref:cytochrome P450 family protein n=1 Tax=Saccharopolyspora soli TaxID=2926618 RepID=UPI001F5A87AB|nr:cytochrome P450 [Saccharopolyspora soli]MCI2423602.1 cytochrome P450 [Saccharopolyspora soli]
MVAWAVTSSDLLRKLLTDPRVSKDPRQHWPRYINGEISEDWPLHIWVSVQNMFTAYGKEHTRLRLLVSKAFTARRTEAQRPRIEQVTKELIDDLAAAPPGEPVDLREKFAYPLPIEVISQLFGVSDHSKPDLRRCVDGIFNTTITPEEAQVVQRDLYAILRDLVEFKRKTPGDDMTSGLIAARDEDGSRLTEAELVDTLLLMISAGHETTVNLLDHAITALLTHPDQLKLVRTGQHTWDDVIEETLRWQAPVANLPLRYAVEDIELDGIKIRKGEAIVAAYGAASREPSYEGEDADSFDIARPNKSHLTFGHGPHFCVGAPLARMEAGIALPALFDRFPELSLAVPPEQLRPLESFIANGHRELPVVCTPAH